LGRSCYAGAHLRKRPRDGTFVARNWDPDRPLFFELDEEEVRTLAAVLAAYERARRKRQTQTG